MSTDCSTNPDFCNFNRVWFVYCDGASFSGNRNEPFFAGSKQLYFRGRRVLDETLEALSSLGLSQAENVLLTGCSAGGMAAYLAADHVHERLRATSPLLRKYKVAPMSGMFLEHANLYGEPVFTREMQHVFELANSTAGANKDCVAAFKQSDRWQCNFAQHAYAYTQAPIFVLNSAFDAWQSICILASVLPPNFPNSSTQQNRAGCCAVAGWAACASNPEQCTQAQLEHVNSYISDFQSALKSAPATYLKAGNGAFVHSCHTHCEAESDEFFTIEVQGTTMAHAVSKWWHSNSSEAAAHTYSPCPFTFSAGATHKCNPTCCSEPNCYHQKPTLDGHGLVGVALPACLHVQLV